MGAMEEGGKVASGAIDALRGSPGLLVLVLLQVITLGVLAYISHDTRARQAAREMALIERCLPHTEKE